MSNDAEMGLLDIFFIFCEVSVQILPLVNWFSYWVVKVLYIFVNKSFVSYTNMNTFS